MQPPKMRKPPVEKIHIIHMLSHAVYEFFIRIQENPNVVNAPLRQTDFPIRISN